MSNLGVGPYTWGGQSYAVPPVDPLPTYQVARGRQRRQRAAVMPPAPPPIGYVPMSGAPAVFQGQYGGNIFKDIWNKAIKPAVKWVKNNHVVSTAAGFIPGVGVIAGPAARMAGLCKKRGRRGMAPRRSRGMQIISA